MIKKPHSVDISTLLRFYLWLRGIDSNYRPLGYEPNELPTAPPRDVTDNIYFTTITYYCQYLYFNYMKKIAEICKDNLICKNKMI